MQSFILVILDATEQQSLRRAWPAFAKYSAGLAASRGFFCSFRFAASPAACGSGRALADDGAAMSFAGRTRPMDVTLLSLLQADSFALCDATFGPSEIPRLGLGDVCAGNGRKITVSARVKSRFGDVAPALCVC